MALDWFQRKKESGEIEINDEGIKSIVKPQLDAIQTSVNSSIDAKMKPMLDFIQEQKDAKDAAARAAALKQRKDDLNIEPEDYITDPEGVMNKRLQPLQEQIMAQSSIIMRGQTLGDMDYYKSDPQFKSKVDALIDSQPLAHRANAAIIMNAYKSVHYDMRQEIADGKIKSQASLAANASSGTGGHSGNGSDRDTDKTTLSIEEKLYAAKLGISEKDWAAEREKMEYV